ncbi:Maltose O-acetyltransferase [Tenacibaculum sp. 190130A14a]|uniref:Maltose O-acetyltransferase n=1 Tax=Tenacibaculum polynesiense TaxID=3137857 RepID=A0ABP1F6Y3_9FLAO
MNEEVKIERARKEDSETLTELTLRSMNYWSYGEEQIEKWRSKLTISSKYIEEKELYKLTISNNLIGFYSYEEEKSKVAKLNYLFVEPTYIGNGYGKLLMNNFLNQLKKQKYEKVLLDSDPNAEKFYQYFGFKTKGKLETSIPGRFLSMMYLDI